MGKLKFGHISGGKASVPLPMGASEVLKSQSARFVKNDTSGRGEIAVAATDYLIGFVESGDQTASSTEGATVVNNIVDLTAIFRVPFIYDGSTYTVNYSAALRYTKRDLAVVSSVQYVDLNTSTKDHVLIVDGSAASATASAINDGHVDVMINPDAWID